MFLDLKKLFNRVWHKCLLYKLTVLDTPIEIVKIIKSFLTYLTFKTKVEDCFSASRHILTRDPQCSCLSPTLYLTYVNHMFKTPKPQPTLNSNNTLFLTQKKNAKRAKIQLLYKLNQLNYPKFSITSASKLIPQKL